MKIAARFWDLISDNFEQREARYPYMHARTIENARKYLKANDLFLDFGCATGIKSGGIFHSKCENMKTIIPIIGTRGDIQPYIALALGLMKAGHAVTVASHPCMRGLDWLLT